MSTSNTFDFLWKNPQQQPTMKLPEGGGMAGFAGQWSCSIVYRFWSEKKLEEYDHPFDGKKPTNNGAFYYFHSHEAASKAGKVLDQQYGPNTVWRWEIPSAGILNPLDDEMRAKFGDVMNQEVSVTTLMSKKQRHELHMIALPSAIQSLAVCVGLIEKSIFNYESLRVDPEVVDDAYQAKVIGGSDGYENSDLWQARIKIWEALGEKNPKAYTMNQGKFDAQSENLRMCLNIIYQPTQLYAQLVSVPDPRVDATYSEGEKRLSIPAVTGIWKDKESMVKDLDLDKPAAVKSTNGASATNGHSANGNGNGASSNGMNPPGDWKDYPAEWKTLVGEIVGAYNGKPRPIIEKALQERDAELQSSYGATAMDFITWSKAA